jgi:hypothetical protein
MTRQPEVEASEGASQPGPLRNNRLDPDYWRSGPDLSEQFRPTQPIALPPAPPRRGAAVLAEVLLAALVSAGVAVGMGWRVVARLDWVVPGAGADPFTGLWSVAWSGHALRPNSGIGLAQLFDGNAFYPADYSLAFGDPLLGFGPVTWAFHGPGALLAAYNVLFVAAPALASLGGYALARQLGAHPVGAGVTGAALAYAPWHYGQFAHLGVVSIGPLLIGLAMLARGHALTFAGRARPAGQPAAREPLRPLWALLGWAACAFQLTLGVGNAVTLTYLLLAATVLGLFIAPVRALRARGDGVPRRPRAGLLVLADLVGAAAFALTGAVMAYPFLRIRAIDPTAVQLARSLDQVAAHSPRPRGLLTAPAVDGTWSRLPFGGFPGAGGDEVRLLPGAILIALAVLGLFVSTWRWWWRAVLAVAALGLAALSVGTRFPAAWWPGRDSPYVLLWRHLPGADADPRPGLLMVPCTLALALLAAGAAGRLGGWGPQGRRGRAPRLRAVLALALPALVVAEGWAVIPLVRPPAPPRAVAEAAAPVVVLPSVPTGDAQIMYWSATRDFPLLANGRSGLTPTGLTDLRTQLAGFPDAASVTYLRVHGFRAVAVLRAPTGQPALPVADRIPDRALNVTRVDYGDSVLFTLSG